ncbi:MAG: Glu-tRNA(Gln) amidotransferase subunit GatD [Sulfolobaceae archaeon]|nr:Glu-tRNA(Gln) amidotransferase subunit GatD [Sulfolobaceae archaeon]
MNLEGYRGKALELLTKLNAEIGDTIRIKKGDVLFEGILMPSYSKYDDILVIKLDNGYNIGISIDVNTQVQLINKGSKSVSRSSESATTSEKSEVKIISTGGTIVSKVEYETGAVRPALTTEEILEFVPEAKKIAKISSEVLFSILSENMKPEYWISIANAVNSALKEGNLGVVVAHGTDTMAYTASALAFSLKKLSGPVVLVGSQRSSDRPSSDSHINLLSAILVAKKAPFAEVVVNMHGESSDTYTLVHRGVKVRKMHTSRRDAFQSINDIPLAKVYVEKEEVKLLRKDYIRRQDENIVDPKFDDRVFLLKYFPGLKPDIIDLLVSMNYRGIIIEGTGLGHVSTNFVENIKKATKDGVFVGMTSQCLFGRVNMNVYTTGRLLQDAGVVPLEDMLPETATVKLMWVLAHADDIETVKRLMVTNLVGEINPRHSIEYFPRWYFE